MEFDSKPLFFFLMFHIQAHFHIVAKGIECSTDSILVANKTCTFTFLNETKPLYGIDVYFKDNVEINELFVIILEILNVCDFKFNSFIEFGKFQNIFCGIPVFIP